MCAVRVTETDIQEALEQCPSLFADGPPGVAPTSLALRRMMCDTAVSEEPFLAQLTIRASLLHGIFSDQVVRVISSHSASGMDPEAEMLETQDGQPAQMLKRFMCSFAGGRAGPVEVHFAPLKTVARMREKLKEYTYPHPRSLWPLCANILDPVRLSIVCDGPSSMLEVRPTLTDSVYPPLPSSSLLITHQIQEKSPTRVLAEIFFHPLPPLHFPTAPFVDLLCAPPFLPGLSYSLSHPAQNPFYPISFSQFPFLRTLEAGIVPSRLLPTLRASLNVFLDPHRATPPTHLPYFPSMGSFLFPNS